MIGKTLRKIPIIYVFILILSEAGIDKYPENLSENALGNNIITFSIINAFNPLICVIKANAIK